MAENERAQTYAWVDDYLSKSLSPVDPMPSFMRGVRDELVRGNQAAEARASAAEERAAAAEARADAAERKRHRREVALALLGIFVGVLSIAVTVLVTILVAN